MPSENAVITGEIIRSLRQLKGFKQSVAAKKMGISQQAFSKIERAKNICPLKIALLIIALESTAEELEKIKSLYPPPPIL